VASSWQSEAPPTSCRLLNGSLADPDDRNGKTFPQRACARVAEGCHDDCIDASSLRDADPHEAAEWAKTHVPGLQRVAKSEEIAAAALTLASDDHPYMTGSALVIDGGTTAYGG
jgi:NAD(P)-dependent dehydrogenase (short-subunit alcohol dehydrogenase family)